MEFAEGYKKFLNDCKTEREVAKFVVAEAEKRGFVPFDKFGKYKAGDKVYYVNRGKSIIATTWGSAPLTEGVRINGAHIDSPRIDIKQNPLYEAGNMAYLDTHYYGGIKKYQWVALPLAVHGVVVKKDGEVKNIVIGEDECDPVLYITDLLPHLGARLPPRSSRAKCWISSSALNP